MKLFTLPKPIVIDTEEKAKELLDKILSSPEDTPWAFDTETSGKSIRNKTTPMLDKIVCWSISDGVDRWCIHGPVDDRGYIDDTELYLDTLKPFFCGTNLKIAHNLKYDMHCLLNHQIEIAHPRLDTMVLHWLWDERKPHDLKSVSRELLELQMTPYNKTFKRLDPADLLAKSAFKNDEEWNSHYTRVVYYSSLDAYVTSLLYTELKKYLDNIPWKDDKSLYDFYTEIETRFTDVLFSMERTGVCIDLERITETEKTITARLDELQYYFNEVSGKHINLNSNPQLRDLLYGKLKLPVVKMTAGGSSGKRESSTDAEALGTLRKHNPEVVDNLLEFRKLSKLLSTYVRGIKKSIDMSPDGRLHPTYNQHITRTGRLCVHKDTIIPTNLGNYKISEIPYTAMVFTHEGNFREVTSVIYKGRETLYRLQVVDGETGHISIICTLDHKFYTPTGWRSLSELEVNDEIFTYETDDNDFFIAHKYMYAASKYGIEYVSKYRSLNYIKSIEYSGVDEVWDIQVKGDHSYAAQGFWNHNSGSSPNTQNIPVRDDIFKLRQLFIPTPGKTLIIADYSQAEIRLIAELSGDKNLIEDLKGDVYKKVCSKILGISEDEVTSTYRDIFKIIVLATNYMMGPRTLSDNISSSIGWENTPYKDYPDKIKLSASLLDQYFELYPSLKSYIRDIPFICKSRKPYPHVRTLLGRYRRLPEILSMDIGAAKMAEREAVNTGPQGGVGDIMRGAMIKIHANQKLKDYGVRLLLQIHDEVVVEVDTDKAFEAAKILVDILEHPLDDYGVTFEIPLLIDYEISDLWVKA
jgi:DNA polymerase I-like protein with 3'-5' exonuclease and polymerase domains